MKKNFFSISRLLWFVCTLLVIVSGGYILHNHIKRKPVSFNLHRTSNNSGIEKWIKFYPKDEKFSIYLPNTPEYIAKKFPIPRSNNTLPYHEYFYKDRAKIISISYTSLPEDWLRWGSKMVLKGAMKVVLAQLKETHLVGQSINTFKSYPSLDFEHYLGERETAGTLVLVGNVLYKIEISYPASDREDVQNELAQFITSFEPKES